MKPLLSCKARFYTLSLSLPIFQSQPNPQTQNLSPSLNLHTPFSILNELYLWHPLRIGWHSIGQSKCRLLRLLALVEPQRFYGVECSWSILLSSLLVLCKQTITITTTIITRTTWGYCQKGFIWKVTSNNFDRKRSYVSLFTKFLWESFFSNK